MARPNCYVCFKPAQTCICGSVRAVRNRTHVVLLQHPRERSHVVGTARIARLGLDNITAETCCHGLAASDAVRAAVGRDAAVLFPHPFAVDLATLPPERLPQQLVVLDGTWPQAKQLYKRNPWLADLQHVRLSPSQPSQYRIRKEPHAHCVSTIEAVVQALQILEPDTTGLDSLLGAFDGLIDTQIDHLRRHGAMPRARNPAADRPPRHIPSVLWQRPLVVVYGEVAGCDTSSGFEHELVYWAAQRLDEEGAAFADYVQPERHAPRDVHLQHMELEASRLTTGLTMSQLRQRWRDFLRPDDVVVAWNQSVLDIMTERLLAGGGLAGAAARSVAPQTAMLKAAFCNYHRGGAGHLERAVREHALEVPAARFPGRPGRRMAAAVAVALHLRRLGAR